MPERARPRRRRVAGSSCSWSSSEQCGVGAVEEGREVAGIQTIHEPARGALVNSGKRNKRPMARPVDSGLAFDDLLTQDVTDKAQERSRTDVGGIGMGF